MTRKNKYQALIATYKKRRVELRDELSKTYKKRISRMSYKIKLWSREIRRIEEKEKKLDAIAQKIEEFTNVSVKRSYPKQGKELNRARSWFFKYCLERGSRSIDLAEYTGCKLSCTPAKSRKRLNRLITSNSHERELWLRFKSFMDHKD